MATLILDDLAQRINQQEAQLQALRRELETRQQQLAELSQRKRELLGQLQEIDAEIAGITGGAPPVKTSRPSKVPAQPSRTVVIGGQPAGNRAAAPPEGRPSRRTPRPSKRSPPKQPTLSGLIVTILREAGRPLTVKELARQAKRRGFRSSSTDFVKVVETRAYDLKRQGIVQHPVGRPGFVLAPSRHAHSRENGQAAHAGKSATSTKPTAGTKSSPGSKSLSGARTHAGASPPKRVPLREVLTGILEKSTKPMSGSELAAAAVKAGYRSSSKNFVDVVWVAAGNMKNVAHVPNQGYRLKRSKV